MTKISYYFGKKCDEIIPAVKSGIIPYEDLEILLEHEKKNKNRITIIRAVEKQLNKIDDKNLSNKRQALKEKRLKSTIKSQTKKLDLVDRIVEVVADSMGKVPEIKKPKLYKSKTDHQEEVALLLLSDSHIGKKTKTYNPDVFKKRMSNLENSMMSIISSLRSIRTIKKLIIVFNGDIIDGEILSTFSGLTLSNL